jgi:CubicO group peptidase (beta-lactamase class C family)
MTQAGAGTHGAAAAMLSSALRQGIGSGFAASFGKIEDIAAGKVPHEIYLGTTGHVPGSLPVDSGTFFDLASLTKILSTTLLAMIRRDRGELRLTDFVGDHLPAGVSCPAGASNVTIAELLTHSSGLPAWSAFYERMRLEFGSGLRHADRASRQVRFDSFLNESKVDPKMRGQVVYSDIGFLLLERCLSAMIDRDIARIFARKEGLTLHYRPLSWPGSRPVQVPGERVMMTEVCPWRGLLQGEVHDDNAWSRGGVAGHAGLFGRLQDVQHWIEALFSGLWVSRSTLREFTRVYTDSFGLRRAYGFDVPSIDGSGSTGLSFSMGSIGHLGFTGTSVWMDLDSGDFAVLLSNRVHPGRADDRIRAVRREFHRIVRGYFWS